MRVSLQSVPNNDDDPTEAGRHDPVTRAEHEAAEVLARAHRQAEAIVAEARSGSSHHTPNPLAALGDNAEEIIGQVRKLITKQRQLQGEREQMITQIETLKSERDELVQRLTDAVERMEELAQIANAAQGRPANSPPPSIPPTPPPPIMPKRANPPMEDTSLAARLRQAEEAEAAARDEETQTESHRDVEPATAHGAGEMSPERAAMVSPDGRSFYDRHSAKLPRLEGDGGRSVLSAIGDMRPDPDPKARKGRKWNKK